MLPGGILNPAVAGQGANSLDWKAQEEIPLLPPNAWDDDVPAVACPFWQCMCPDVSQVQSCVEQVRLALYAHGSGGLCS